MALKYSAAGRPLRFASHSGSGRFNWHDLQAVAQWRATVRPPALQAWGPTFGQIWSRLWPSKIWTQWTQNGHGHQYRISCLPCLRGTIHLPSRKDHVLATWVNGTIGTATFGGRMPIQSFTGYVTTYLMAAAFLADMDEVEDSGLWCRRLPVLLLDEVCRARWQRDPLCGSNRRPVLRIEIECLWNH